MVREWLCQDNTEGQLACPTIRPRGHLGEVAGIVCRLSCATAILQARIYRNAAKPG
jgi:hypothetical protein